MCVETVEHRNFHGVETYMELEGQKTNPSRDFLFQKTKPKKFKA